MTIDRVQSRLGLSVSEAAQHLGVSVSTVRRWSDAGHLSGYRTPGGQRRFTIEQLDTFLGGLNGPGRPQALELRERIARAISDADDGALLAAGVGPIPWDELTDQDRETYLEHADVAITHIVALYHLVPRAPDDAVPPEDGVERGAIALAHWLFPGYVVPRDEMAAAVLAAQQPGAKITVRPHAKPPGAPTTESEPDERWHELGLALVAEDLLKPGVITDQTRDRLKAVLRRTFAHTTSGAAS